jgi:hypothetical protein
VQGSLPNGAQVWRIYTAPDPGGRRWVEVALREGGDGAGWVFEEYLNCPPELETN